MRLEEAVELLPRRGRPDLLVMELATGGERTIDGIADGERVLLGHPKTREAMRAGLAMYFVTLDDPALMEIADRIVAELGIEHFFNIQLVGDHVIEINPRISTIVYQEDLNLPYLGVKRALGEISDEELAALRVAHPAGPDGAALLRPARVGRVTAAAVRGDAARPPHHPPPTHGAGHGSRLPAHASSADFAPMRDATMPSRRREGRPLRVVHCPSTRPAIPWTNVAGAAAARRRRASSSSSSATALHPEADESLDRRGGFARARQARAVARARPAAAAHRRLPLLLRAHARAEVAAVPAPARAAARSPSCTTSARTSAARRPSELAYGKRAGAEIVGCYDAIRWVPEAEVIPPGIDLAAIEPAPPSDRARPLIVHAPSSRRRKGTEHVIAAVRGARRRPRARRGPPPRRGVRALPRRRTSSSTS